MYDNENDLSPALVTKDETELFYNIAVELDKEINEKVNQLNSLFAVMTELAKPLKAMKDSKGYLALGFQSWTAYLDSKPCGKTYKSYALKYGAIEDTSAITERNIPPGLLAQYLSNTDFPARVPDLIEATWEEVKGIPVEKAKPVIKDFVAKNKSIYKKERKPRRLKTTTPPEPIKVDELAKDDGRKQVYLANFIVEYETLGYADQVRYRAQMQKFLRNHA